ncbi:hypothetical protein AC579_6465 [Lecanosticta acicola]|uniref:F-box domain-containing protein n=1 Tax=Lecanosticta acicola TaxID=111012 RepID=A0AAI8YVC2_9PEZI|nr:hypothetical protein AC579_6465 [Lecanosticta acicola]
MGLRFLDLPSELLIAITERADLKDALNIRLTSRTLAKVNDFLLKDRQERLYLHPRSLAWAIDFCHNEGADKWRDQVKEIVIIGQSTPDMRTRDMGPGLGVHGMLDFKLDFHVWDQWPPDPNVVSDGKRVVRQRDVVYQDLIDSEFHSFSENYATLLRGLANLPMVNTIRYAGSTREFGPGFCGATDESVYGRAMERQHWQACFGNEGQPKMHWALRTVWWSDAHVFTGILSSKLLQERVRTVDIRQPFPAVRRYNQGDITGAPTITQEALYVPNLGPCIKELSFVVPGGDGWVAWLMHLAKNMRALEDLRIQFASSLAKNALRPVHGHETLPRETMWEEDSTQHPRRFLVLFGKVLDRSKPRLRRVTIRPVTSAILSCDPKGLFALLDGSKSSLRQIVIENIIFFPETIVYPAAEDVRDGLRHALKFLRDEVQLDSMVYRVNMSQNLMRREEMPLPGLDAFAVDHPDGSNAEDRLDVEIRSVVEELAGCKMRRDGLVLEISLIRR